MIESSFKNAAEKFKGTYEVSHFNVAGNQGAINPISIFKFSMFYKNVLITVKYEIGNYNLAEIIFEIPISLSTLEFRIETSDNFNRLFTNKKNPWKITTKTNLFTNKLIAALCSSGLTKWANETSFEPIILGKNTNNNYIFNTTFYLGFENKESILDSVIDFHQKVIDIVN